MREIIYLVADSRSVRRMTKRVPDLRRGEILVKLAVEVDPAAFREPAAQHIKITDWAQALNVPDVSLQEMSITDAEAELIRRQRVQAMADLLTGEGYTVTPGEAAGVPQA